MLEDLLLRHAAEATLLLAPARFALGEAVAFFGRPVERQQQRRHRQLAAAVDADIDEVLGVELEIEPRAAIGDDPGGEQVFARGVGLALVVVEEHAGRAVHLADDDALGAVDDEGAVVRHQRHVAHIDVLLLDVADRARAGVLVDVPDDEAQRHLERRGEGHAALLALLDVVFRLFELVATNSSWARSEKSRIGKTDLKTSCSPTLPRFSAITPICKKWSYELRCTSIRLGIGATSGMRPKLLRIRLRPVNDLRH